MVHSEVPDNETTNEPLPSEGKPRNESRQLRHVNARTIDEALSLLAEYGEGSKIKAGGVDVIGLMRNRVISPKILVNIKTIPDLRYIQGYSDGLKIGALATIKDIATSSIVVEKYPMLTDAARSVAAPHIRGMGTIAGNLCQDTRCWYYRRPPVTGTTFFCHKKGGQVCYALAGQNAYHAIIGGKRCHRVSPSDMAPPLIALGAKVKVVGTAGERIVPLEEFYSEFGNDLSPAEIIVEVQVPAPKDNTRQQYLKFRYRKSIDFAISSVAAVIRMERETVGDARIVLGGVAPTPCRAKGAEEVLKGEKLTQGLAEIAAKAALEKAKPLSMNRYKVPLTEALVRRALSH
jgi:xanthine dehydrogenase YagS FAD-binding subunit